jgi:hypothetical protein
MCIKIYCQFCNDLIPTKDLRRSTCSKPECQKKLSTTHTKWKRPELRCKICNGIIPIGSKRRYYCCDACHKVAINNKAREDQCNLRENRKLKLQ